MVAIMDGRPFVAEGRTVDDAVGDLIDSLREYADEWESRYRQTDAQLNEWLELGGE